MQGRKSVVPSKIHYGFSNSQPQNTANSYVIDDIESKRAISLHP